MYCNKGLTPKTASSSLKVLVSKSGVSFSRGLFSMANCFFRWRKCVSFPVEKVEVIDMIASSNFPSSIVRVMKRHQDRGGMEKGEHVQFFFPTTLRWSWNSNDIIYGMIYRYTYIYEIYINYNLNEIWHLKTFFGRKTSQEVRCRTSSWHTKISFWIERASYAVRKQIPTTCGRVGIRIGKFM